MTGKVMVIASLTLFAIGHENLMARGEKKITPKQHQMREYVDEAKARVSEYTPSPGSLWVESGRNSNLFYDFKARNIDDVVTIKIVESTNALSSSNLATKRENNSSTSIPNLFGIQRNIRELANLVKSILKSDNKDTLSTNRTNTIKTTITARVRDVLPNGNLLIEAAKEVKVNGENQLLTISGIVRPKDISPDNVVLSDAISDMQVGLTGRRGFRERFNPEVVMGLVSKLFMF